MITKENFLMEFNGASNSYSTYLVLNTTIDAVIDVLNKIGDIDERCVGSGYERDGNVGFEIFGETPELIHDITKELQTIGYADTDWDSTYTACSKNGSDFDDYTAEWEPDMHYYRGDFDEDDDSWDAFVIITDNTTGTQFHTGAGAVDKEIEQYYADMVAKHGNQNDTENVESKTNQDLGTFTVDVQLQSDGKFDVYVAHEGSSGEHYENVTADKIGEIVSDDVECIAEAYQNVPVSAETAQNWIIGVSGCEMDDVIISRVYGTEKQVKKHLIKLIKEDKDEDYGRFDYGTTTLKEIEKRSDGSLYGYAVYSRYHNDYVATPEAETPVESLS